MSTSTNDETGPAHQNVYTLSLALCRSIEHCHWVPVELVCWAGYLRATSSRRRPQSFLPLLHNRQTLTLGFQWPVKERIRGARKPEAGQCGAVLHLFLSLPLPPIPASLAESPRKTKVSCMLKNTTENNYWNLKTKQERKQSVPSALLCDPYPPTIVQFWA